MTMWDMGFADVLVSFVMLILFLKGVGYILGKIF